MPDRAAAAQREADAQARRLDLLTRVTGALIHDDLFQERLDEALNAIADELGAAFYFNYVLHEIEPGKLRLASSRGVTPAQHDAFAIIASGEHLCGKVAKERRAIVLDHLQIESDPGALGIRGMGITAYCGVPMLAETRLMGTIAFGLAEGAQFKPDQVRLVHTAASQIAAAMDRNRLTRTLRESEARFRELADNAPVMIWVTEPDGSCSFLSRSWYEFTGQTPATGLGLGWLDATHPDDQAEAGRVFLAANERHGNFRVEYRLRRADGVYIYAIDAAAPRFGGQGEFLGYVGSVIDISERKKAESALRASEARFRAAVDAVQGILWTNNAAGQMQGEQPGWGALTGQSQQQYEGYGWASAVHPDDAQATLEAWNSAVARRTTFIFEHRIKRHDGQWRTFSVRAIPTTDATGEIVEWVGVHTDVTEKRESEDALKELTTHLEDRVRKPLPNARTSKPRCSSCRRWRPWASSPVVSRTTSTTCWRPSSAAWRSFVARTTTSGWAG